MCVRVHCWGWSGVGGGGGGGGWVGGGLCKFHLRLDGRSFGCKHGVLSLYHDLLRKLHLESPCALAGSEWAPDSRQYQDALAEVRTAHISRVESHAEDLVFKLRVLQQAKERDEGKNAKQLANGVRRTRRWGAAPLWAGGGWVCRLLAGWASGWLGGAAR